MDKFTRNPPALAVGRFNPQCKDCWRGWLTRVDPPRELESQKRVGYERQGAGYDPGACGHELQGRK
jgi:hypothetical protein